MSSLLLLIACSGRKSQVKGRIPAIDRYDGVSYKIIRKLQREGHYPSDLDIKILSAEYGLIDANTPIPFYDRRMNKKRAEELHKGTLEKISALLNGRKYSKLFINLGKDYMRAIDGYQEFLDPKTEVRIAEGGIGLKSKAMKEWIQNQYRKG